MDLDVSFKFFNNFLLKIQNYFSRRACLHFIGNNLGKLLCQKVGTLIIVSTLVIDCYILDKESQTGNYAINKMHEYLSKTSQFNS
jgi:hypothetical protein